MKTDRCLGLCIFFVFYITSHAGAENRRSLTFEEAGKLAAAASAELRYARSQRALREGVWVLGLRAYLPQVTFLVSEDERLSQISADSFIKTYSINLDQLLFDGGRTRAGRYVERAELALLSDDLKLNEMEIIEAAISAYRQILLLRMRIEIREKALVSLREQQRILEEELSLGLVRDMDRMQAEITVKEAGLELQSFTIQLEDHERQFIKLLGLSEMPELAETVDITHSPPIPEAEVIRRVAVNRNPGLKRLRHSVVRQEREFNLVSQSWIPTLRATGSFSVSGQNYPLTRWNWSLGFSIQFSSPWFNAASGGSAGWEPPYDKTARVQASFSPLPDPASGLGTKQAALALALEQENYRDYLEGLEQEGSAIIRSLALSERRRALTVEALNLAAEKYRLNEVLRELGRITRIELMEERLEYEQKEMEATEAAIALLEAQRVLERFIDLAPGTLEEFIFRNKFAFVQEQAPDKNEITAK
ncbi:MAG: TolC family protein [Spirochaetaceae bacterium]|jgi:outer membrane protein TolC|nr:TolC family protein [Spirochaetaceae bacterium]